MPSKRSQCRNCGKLGHYSKVCKNKFVSKEVFEADVNREGEDELESIYNINVFQIRESGDNSNNDFKVQLLINNNLETLLADTGAKICVCGDRQARTWNISQVYYGFSHRCDNSDRPQTTLFNI